MTKRHPSSIQEIAVSLEREIQVRAHTHSAEKRSDKEEPIPQVLTLWHLDNGKKEGVPSR